MRKEGGPPTGSSRRPLAGSYGSGQRGRPSGSTVQPPCGSGPPPSGCQVDPISQNANNAAPSKIAAFIVTSSSVEQASGSARLRIAFRDGVTESRTSESSSRNDSCHSTRTGKSHARTGGERENAPSSVELRGVWGRLYALG